MGEQPRADETDATSEHEAAVFAAELGDCVSVDLHGLDTIDAIRELDTFLNHVFMNRTEVVKIIHGRGEQKLRKAVEKHLSDLLRKHALIDYFRGSAAPSQAGAVTYAVLIRK